MDKIDLKNRNNYKKVIKPNNKSYFFNYKYNNKYNNFNINANNKLTIIKKEIKYNSNNMEKFCKAYIKN